MHTTPYLLESIWSGFLKWTHPSNQKCLHISSLPIAPDNFLQRPKGDMAHYHCRRSIRHYQVWTNFGWSRISKIQYKFFTWHWPTDCVLKQATNHYLNPWWSSLWRCLCTTWPHWIKGGRMEVRVRIGQTVIDDKGSAIGLVYFSVLHENDSVDVCFNSLSFTWVASSTKWPNKIWNDVTDLCAMYEQWI